MKTRWLTALLAVMVIMGLGLTLGACDDGSSKEWDDFFVDSFTHATPGSKTTLTGTQYDIALQFLQDSSHYAYADRATYQYNNPVLFPKTGMDTDWRSPVNTRNYRGPFFDPITRSVNWLTVNPNGSVNVSLGSYWMCLPPNKQLTLNYNELQNYKPYDKWQIVTSMGPGQSVSNFLERKRGTFAIDGALVRHYGLANGFNTTATYPGGMAGTAGPTDFNQEGRNVIFVEVKLREHAVRQCTAKQYYEGWLPATASGGVMNRWRALDGWRLTDPDPARTTAQFYGYSRVRASNTDPWTEDPLNIPAGPSGDTAREAYLVRANNPAVLEAIAGAFVDMYFDIMGIVNVTAEIGLDIEGDSGVVNGIDRDHDGWLDKYPMDWGGASANALQLSQRGKIILQETHSHHMLPDWYFELNFHDPWWTTGVGFVAPHLRNPRVYNADGYQIIGLNNYPYTPGSPGGSGLNGRYTKEDWIVDTSPAGRIRPLETWLPIE